MTGSCTLKDHKHEAPDPKLEKLEQARYTPVMHPIDAYTSGAAFIGVLTLFAGALYGKDNVLGSGEQEDVGAHNATVVMEEDATDIAERFTSTRMWRLQALFCLGTALAVGRTMPAIFDFYDWFTKCGLEISKHRGFGQTASPAYGLWHPPKLSVPAFRAVGVAFLASLLGLVAVPTELTAPRVALTLAAFALYFLYFSQVYCEAHVGAHVTVLIPPALILLATTGAMDEDVDDKTAALAGAFTAWLMKVVITSAYCGAGVAKLHKSVKTGKFWCSGTTMQACIFEGLFMSNKDTHTSFGVPTPFSHYVQRLIVQFPTLMCMPASLFAVGFETFAPLILLAPANPGSILFTVVGIKFHYGIALMQNIDFVSWWAPAYAFFAMDPAAAGPAEGCGLWEAATASFEAAPIRTTIAATYVLTHVIAVVVLRFFPKLEILPLSAFPMYSVARDLHDPSIRDTLYLSEKPHATGTLKNYSFPFCRPQTVTREELPRLAFRWLGMKHGGNQPVDIMTNVEMTPELSDALHTYRTMTSEEPPALAALSARSPALRARRLTDALMRAREAFRAAPRTKIPATPTSRRS